MIIHSKRIYLEDGCKAGYLEIEDRKIKNFYPEGSDAKADIDYGNNRIIPGIFDTHNHGGFGYDFIRQSSKEDLKNYFDENSKEYKTEFKNMSDNRRIMS